MGRLCKAAAGMDLAQANRLSCVLLDRYEDHIEDAPAGGTLHEIYDLDGERPRPAYIDVYNKVAAELRGLGVPIEDLGTD
jgi:hypothetical protein